MSAEEWNTKYPIGTAVIVTKFDGVRVPSKTVSKAWIVGRGWGYVGVDGFMGGYPLERIRPSEPK